MQAGGKVDISVEADGFLFVAKEVSSFALPAIVEINGLSAINSIRELLERNRKELVALEKSQIADGSHLSVVDNDATPIVNSPENFFVNYNEANKKSIRKYKGRRVIGVNFDDLRANDYIGTRKILNKYGFNASFNFILQPFTDLAEKKSMVENVKQLLEDGNDLGLHALFSSSFWIYNSLFDFNPSFNSLFAPKVSEIKTINVETSKNIFGYTINNNTKLAQAGFVNPPASLTNVNVVDLTTSNWYDLIENYCLYWMLDTYSGLDLEDNVVTKAGLTWLEYWYNKLIDNTLGYSTVGTKSVSTRYGADYEVPSGGLPADYYPRAAQMLSGKIVFFDDTTNAHYAEALVATDPNFTTDSYQLVGRFSKGLFKGCASSCNGEVIDRCIDVANAFCRHYFCSSGFKSFGKHGSRYSENFWYDDDNAFAYQNREKTVFRAELGKIYISRAGKFMSGQDILHNCGSVQDRPAGFQKPQG